MDGYLTISQVAEIYAVSTKTVRRWIARGDVQTKRLPGGRLLRIDAASIAVAFDDLYYRGYATRRGGRS